TPETQAPSSENVRTVSGTLVIRQLTGDGSYTELRSFPDANDKALLTLKEDGTASEESITVSDLPCWTDLSRISLAFLAEGSSSSVLAVIPESDIISFDYRDASTQDAAFTVTSPDGTVFTSTIKITLTRSAHQLSGAECLDQTCSVCGQTFTASKDHTPGAAATCTSPQTCETCGTVLASALGHDWQAANCTAPKTCKRCHATEGAALGHDLRDDWSTASASTNTEHGSQTRSCHREGCDHKETRALNILGSAADNSITGLTEGGQYDLNARLSFTAVGAAMGNTSPIPGDVRYVPSSWNIQTVTGKFSDNFSGAFSISKAGSYTVTVSFQKQVYDTSWKNTNIADSKSVTFRVGQLISGNPVNGTVDGVRIIPQTGDETPLVPIIIAFVTAILVIVGGIVFLRRRKR
ncbi:MAG: LPXTG cell wall anchor domain-containing protein, partial [Eubacteriales bacterium]|nr:LPXTG cell wall anchor domain-containing protein [Eubacteriales bacterium]